MTHWQALFIQGMATLVYAAPQQRSKIMFIHPCSYAHIFGREGGSEGMFRQILASGFKIVAYFFQDFYGKLPLLVLIIISLQEGIVHLFRFLYLIEQGGELRFHIGKNRV